MKNKILLFLVHILLFSNIFSLSNNEPLFTKNDLWNQNENVYFRQNHLHFIPNKQSLISWTYYKQQNQQEDWEIELSLIPKEKVFEFGIYYSSDFSSSFFPDKPEFNGIGAFFQFDKNDKNLRFKFINNLDQENDLNPKQKISLIDSKILNHFKLKINYNQKNLQFQIDEQLDGTWKTIETILDINLPIGSYFVFSSDSEIFVEFGNLNEKIKEEEQKDIINNSQRKILQSENLDPISLLKRIEFLKEQRDNLTDLYKYFLQIHKVSSGPAILGFFNKKITEIKTNIQESEIIVNRIADTLERVKEMVRNLIEEKKGNFEKKIQILTSSINDLDSVTKSSESRKQSLSTFVQSQRNKMNQVIENKTSISFWVLLIIFQSIGAFAYILWKEKENQRRKVL
ncbi:lectin mannose-binding 1 [Anaeramoeba ignava]|uniref:Lectin mannose-binding 1 n=1 Tax=Anaeramoeba ignava TaxID=1746090 RepID=A0A9Q0RB42_ANAIG|nr:lectin mannose-binding 1 [Anaeramoeba ignava]